jgi:hypothetical protein
LEGQGIYISFKYSTGSEYELFYSTGIWQDTSYRRFGIYPYDLPRADLWQGAEALNMGDLPVDVTLKPDIWYSLLLTIDKGGNFLALIWDPNDPGHPIRYQEVKKDWQNNQWMLFAQANQGKIEFKNYTELSFSGYKK